MDSILVSDARERGVKMAKSLMKRDQAGNIYKRPPSIEAKIDTVLGKNTSTLQQLAMLGRRSPDYIPSECLVHLIRNAVTPRGF